MITIVAQAWSPIGGITFYRDSGRSSPLADPVIGRIAQAHGKSPAQVMLRWGLQHGRSVIPKSVRPQRIGENIDVFDFTRTDAEMTAIDGLDTDHRGGPRQPPNAGRISGAEASRGTPSIPYRSASAPLLIIAHANQSSGAGYRLACDQGGVTRMANRLENGLRMNGLAPGPGRAADTWSAAVGLGALAAPGANLTSLTALVIASVRTMVSTAAISVSVIALGWWRR